MAIEKSNILTPQKLGLTCPDCGSIDTVTSQRTFANGTVHVEARCAKCHRFEKWLPKSKLKYRMAATPPAESNHPATLFLETSHWIGYCRWSDGCWRPIAMAPSLNRLWEALLDFPNCDKLDLLAWPAKLDKPKERIDS